MKTRRRKVRTLPLSLSFSGTRDFGLGSDRLYSRRKSFLSLKESDFEGEFSSPSPTTLRSRGLRGPVKVLLERRPPVSRHGVIPK